MWRDTLQWTDVAAGCTQRGYGIDNSARARSDLCRVAPSVNTISSHREIKDKKFMTEVFHLNLPNFNKNIEKFDKNNNGVGFHTQAFK